MRAQCSVVDGCDQSHTLNFESSVLIHNEQGIHHNEKASSSIKTLLSNNEFIENVAEEICKWY